MFNLQDIDLIIEAQTDPSKPLPVYSQADDANNISIVSADGLVALSSIKTPQDVLTLGSAEFVPTELASFKDFVLDARPNLLRHNQPYEDGVSKYLMSTDAPDGSCGWFLVVDGVAVSRIKEDQHLQEAFAPEFYGGKVPSKAYGDGYVDHHLLNANESLIRLMSNDYLFSIEETLHSKWSINKVITLASNRAGNPQSMRYITIQPNGSITALNVDGCYDRNVKAKDIYPVASSWCRTNKVMFDTYRSQFILRGRPINDKALAGYIAKISSELGINFKPSDFKPVLMSYALDNEYNSLQERYLELEKMEELQLLEAYDHTNVAGEFLKITRGDEHIKFANKVLEVTLEKMVIRALYPGFPHRETLILSGAQLGGKSGFLKELCGEDHFDEIQALSSGDGGHGGTAHPDTQRKLSQNNMIVINEIGRAFRDITDDHLKDFITGETCSYVEKYSNDICRRGRTSIIVGTTNSPNILVDLTGNTRYQIVLCGMTPSNPIDWEKLARVKQGMLLSAVKAVRKIANEGGIKALKQHGLPDWAMAYSEKQNLEFLAGSEYIGLLAPLVHLTNFNGEQAVRTTVGASEIYSRLGIQPSEARKVMKEIELSMKHLGYRRYEKRVRFNGLGQATVFILNEMDKPKSQESESDFFTDAPDY